jgi:hypothetical protein
VLGRQKVFLKDNAFPIPKVVPPCAKDSSDEAEHRLHTNPKDDESIGRLFYFAKFGLTLRRIHHDFGLMTCKYRDTIYPICVSQRAASHADVVDIQAEQVFLIFIELDITLVLVKEFIGRFAFNYAFVEVVHYLLIIFRSSEALFRRLLVLEIRFTV